MGEVQDAQRGLEDSSDDRSLGHLPSAAVITNGKKSDIKTARSLRFEPDSIPIELRRVRYVDPKTGKAYEFLTNIFHLSAKEIADIYKARWDIELFFKWIKQNLKVKSFFGTSENAVRIQIWSALCVYLMLAYLKFISNSRFSLTNLLIRIRTNIMAKIRLAMVLYEKPHQTHPINIEHQLTLAFGG